MHHVSHIWLGPFTAHPMQLLSKLVLQMQKVCFHYFHETVKNDLYERYGIYPNEFSTLLYAFLPVYFFLYERHTPLRHHQQQAIIGDVIHRVYFLCRLHFPSLSKYQEICVFFSKRKR